MTLKDCTKKDLLFILDRIQKRIPHSSYYIETALSDIAFERESKWIEASSAAFERMMQADQAYCELLLPYKGVPLKEIPDSILERARELGKAVESAAEELKRLEGSYRREQRLSAR